jgi:type IX secretion system PorP/SprF family membrane protein
MGGFDQSIPNQENFSRTNITGFDANFGVFYKYTDKLSRSHPFMGISVYHVTRPNESFSSSKIKTPMRFNIHGGSDFEISQTVKLTPRVLYMNEAKASELNVGILSYYKIKDTPYEAILQLDYRNKDAVVLGLGLKHYQHIFRLSYDVNTSSLGPYIGNQGSWEFAIILTGRKGRPFFGK